MEDVVLHYRPGAAQGLQELLARTEKLLEPFPCRPPPVFTPWFPTAGDPRRPIRPRRAAPVITRWRHEDREDSALPEDTPPPDEAPAGPQPSRAVPDPPASAGGRRRWSVCGREGVWLQRAPPPTRRFQHAVSTYKLHPRQRAQWVIRRHNWGAAADMEKVWSTLSQWVRSSRLPTCNAHIQREQQQIGVFCDLRHAEQVGRLLKELLQLEGRIQMEVHRHGHVYSI